MIITTLNKIPNITSNGMQSQIQSRKTCKRCFNK